MKGLLAVGLALAALFWLPVGAVGPGDSIQAAIDAATPADIIVIEPGTYLETIDVHKPLTLRGNGSGVIISGSGAHNVAITADNVTLERLELEGGAQDGVLAVAQTRILLRSVDVREAVGNGVEIRDASRVRLEDVSARAGGTGVRLVDSEATLDGVTTVGGERGVHLLRTPGTGSGIDVSRFSGDGVVIEDSPDVTLEGVVAEGGASGIWALGSDRLRLVDVATRDQLANGIRIHDLERVALEDIDVRAVGAGIGIELIASEVQASRVVIEDIGGTALRLQGAESVVIDDLRVRSSTRAVHAVGGGGFEATELDLAAVDGIIMEGVTDIRIIDADVTADGIGLWSLTAEGLHLERATIRADAGVRGQGEQSSVYRDVAVVAVSTGMHHDDADDLVFDGVRVDGAAGNGVNIFDSSAVSWTGGAIRDAGRGMYVLDSTDVTVSGAEVARMTGDGIVFERSSPVRALGNTVTNTNLGIWYRGHDALPGSRIADNVLAANRVGGISLDFGATAVVVEDNTLSYQFRAIKVVRGGGAPPSTVTAPNTFLGNVVENSLIGYWSDKAAGVNAIVGGSLHGQRICDLAFTGPSDLATAVGLPSTTLTVHNVTQMDVDAPPATTECALPSWSFDPVPPQPTWCDLLAGSPYAGYEGCSGTARRGMWMVDDSPGDLWFLDLAGNGPPLLEGRIRGLLEGRDIESLAFDPEGDLWFVNGPRLYRIPASELDGNPATDVDAVPVGHTGLTGGDDPASLDWIDGRLVTMGKKTHRLWELDRTDGSTTLIADLPHSWNADGLVGTEDGSIYVAESRSSNSKLWEAQPPSTMTLVQVLQSTGKVEGIEADGRTLYFADDHMIWRLRAGDLEAWVPHARDTEGLAIGPCGPFCDAPPPDEQTIHAKAIDDHECDATEWHFVITAGSPASITVSWGPLNEVVPLERVTGNVAHYVTTSTLDQPVTRATAVVDGSWDGQFNLSHGPCFDGTRLGSITVCKLLVDTEGQSIAGTVGRFTLPGIAAPGPDAQELPDSQFHAPLVYHATHAGHDAQCVMHELDLGSYAYGEEQISTSGYGAPMYHDQFSGTAGNLDDFAPYSGELFDDDPDNDDSRDRDADGHIVLTHERPHRLLLVLNQEAEPPGPQDNWVLDRGPLLLERARVTLHVIGTHITLGEDGPDIPVYGRASTDGGDRWGRLNGRQAIDDGDIFDLGTLPAGSHVGVEGRARGQGFSGDRFDSFDDSERVWVLVDGDEIPNQPGFGSQPAVSHLLAPFEEDGFVVLDDNEILLLFELGSSASGPAADFQDLVVIVTVAPRAGQEPGD